jgi:hypothetical protein
MELPASQANFAGQRHRCAVCAYELGRAHAQESEERLRQRVRDLTAELSVLKKK